MIVFKKLLAKKNLGYVFSAFLDMRKYFSVFHSHFSIHQCLINQLVTICSEFHILIWFSNMKCFPFEFSENYLHLSYFIWNISVNIVKNISVLYMLQFRMLFNIIHHSPLIWALYSMWNVYRLKLSTLWLIGISWKS